MDVGIHIISTSLTLSTMPRLLAKKDLQKIFYETAEKPELKEVIAYELHS